VSLSRRLLAAAFLLLASSFAHAQAYTSIVVFGDSLSDTGNDAFLTATKYTVNAQVPGPASNYTNGRFTDGTDTSPAAHLYNGVWIEQLAALLPNKPPVKASLLGGTNYAFGTASTGTATSQLTYGPGGAFSVPVENMRQQLADYLATTPTITNKTLFVLWGGANDLLAATPTTASQIVTQAITNETLILQTLIASGATDFLVVGLPPLGLIPRLNASPTTSVPANQIAAAFNTGLAAALTQIATANAAKGVHLFNLDTYTLFNTIVGPPLFKGYANVTEMSRANTTDNPDTYLFWDDLHPTTYTHSLLATAALTALGTPVLTTTALAVSNASVNLGSTITLTASVTAAAGTPNGTVTFLDGATSLGTGLVFGSTATATATLTTSALTAGTHTITASFAGANGYASSISAPVSATVTAPAFIVQAALQPITVKSGQSGNSALSFSTVGNYTGTVTFACGTLPAHFTCTIAPASVTFPSTTTSAAITIGTSGATAMLNAPQLPGSLRNGISTSGIGNSGILAATLVGFLGLLSTRRRSTLRKRLQLLSLLAISFLAITGSLTGCSGASNNSFAPTGAYTIPIIVTTGNVPNTLNLSVTVN
jgi:phospholipase/lecithinase/hemolysin